MADAPRPPEKGAAADAAAHPHQPLSAAALRREAEERLAGLAEVAARVPEELTAAVHELRVHEIELEMQNEELRRAQHALEASRAKYFALFDLAPVGYVTLDHKGHIVAANLPAARLLGVERASLLGQHLGRFVLKEDRDRYYLHLRSLSGDAAHAACDVRLARPSEETHWVHLESATYASQDGGALQQLIVISDVTDSKQASAELARHGEHLEQLVAARTDELQEANRILAERAVEVALSQQNFNAFFNTIDDLLFVLDAGGTMIHVNETVCRRLGYSEAELLGRPVLDVHPPARRDEAGRIVAAMLAGEAAFCPVPVVTKGGAEIPVETRVVPGVWDGEPALFGVTKDVSALKLSEEKFSRAFHSAPALTAISTVAEGRFIDVNEVFLTTLGFTRQEVIGRTSAELGALDDQRVRAEVLDLLATQGRARNIAMHVRARDGRIVHGLFSADALVVAGEPCLLTTMLDVTERQRVEEALRASEERYRLLIERSQDIIYTLSADGVFTFVSPAWTTLLGHPLSEVVGQPWDGFVHPDDVPGCRAFMRRAREPGRRREVVEYRMRHLDGSWRRHASSAGPSTDEAGTVVGFEGTARDITDRTRVEEALHESEAQLASAIHGSGVGLWDWYVQTGAAAFNARWAEIVGCTLAELAPLSIETWTSRCHPADLQRSGDLLEAHFAGQSDLYECEARMRHKDGHWVWVLDRGKVSARDGDGRPLRMVGTHLDISARKEAEEALHESEAQLASAIDGSGIGLWDWHVQTGEEVFSARLAEIVGYTLEELAPSSFEVWKGLCHPDDLRRSDALLEEHFAGRSAMYECELRLRHKDGHWVWVLDRGKVSEWDDEGRPVRMIGTNLDITERKRAEEALRESEEALRVTIENSFDVIFTLDEGGVFLFVSAAWERQFGFPVGDVLHKSFVPFVHPDDVAPLTGYLARVLSLGKAETSPPYRVKHADGSWRWLVSNGALYVAAEGARRYIGVARDITARKQAEQKALLFAQAQTELRERRQAEEALARSARELREQLRDTVKAMGAIVSLRDPYTAAHEQRVTTLAVAIAHEMGLDEEACEGLAFAGEVHDIGKIGIPAEILSKPGALTAMEYALIKEHPQAGRDLLAGIRFRQPVAEIVGQHQERLDGSGYPGGLKGEEIMLEARILAVADVVEAMSSHRPYRASLGLEAALAEVHAGAGARYDAEAVAACERVFAEGFIFGES